MALVDEARVEVDVGVELAALMKYSSLERDLLELGGDLEQRVSLPRDLEDVPRTPFLMIWARGS